MTTNDPASSWPQKLSGQIGRTVRAWRQQRQLSLEALAKRCERLGYPVLRTNLYHLESGRRKTLSIQELLVLSAALQVQPAVLIASPEHPLVEALPGVNLLGAEMYEWVTGRLGAPYDPLPNWEGYDLPEGFSGWPEEFDSFHTRWLADYNARYCTQHDALLEIGGLPEVARLPGKEVRVILDWRRAYLRKCHLIQAAESGSEVALNRAALEYLWALRSAEDSAAAAEQVFALAVDRFGYTVPKELVSMMISIRDPTHHRSILIDPSKADDRVRAALEAAEAAQTALGAGAQALPDTDSSRQRRLTAPRSSRGSAAPPDENPPDGRTGLPRSEQ
jgi:transcriptional regulator with XRE-family HTH domain